MHIGTLAVIYFFHADQEAEESTRNHLNNNSSQVASMRALKNSATHNFSIFYYFNVSILFNA